MRIEFNLGLGAAIASIVFSACVGAAQGNVAQSAEETKLPAEVLSLVKEVVEHGDLSDVAFLERTLGIQLQQFPEKKSTFNYDVCGFIMPPLPIVTVRQSIFTKIPWFLDEKSKGRSFCSFDLVEHIETGKIVGLIGRLTFDTEKVCILESDIMSTFPAASRADQNKAWNFILIYHGKVNTQLAFLSGARAPVRKCVAEMLFSQNFN